MRAYMRPRMAAVPVKPQRSTRVLLHRERIKLRPLSPLESQTPAMAKVCPCWECGHPGRRRGGVIAPQGLLAAITNAAAGDDAGKPCRPITRAYVRPMTTPFPVNPQRSTGFFPSLKPFKGPSPLEAEGRSKNEGWPLAEAFQRPDHLTKKEQIVSCRNPRQIHPLRPEKGVPHPVP